VERVLALAILTALLPLLALIALAVWLTSDRPIVYRRRVVGLKGVEFDAFKFRTMVKGAERILEQDDELRQAFAVNWKLFADPRVTRLGRVLRKYSLDELLQLVNVLKGDMALIGPRIVTAAELGYYGGHAERLLSVKPGLTGLWQVSGRQLLSYDRRVELDMHYVEHCSLSLDVVILARTLPVVLKADGAY
jgi:lipopolysaccharide/colanic/teichoic acid biosynthesis glycosyltransferase